MRLFLLGADGQVGHELCGALECFAQVTAVTEADFDMTNESELRARLRDAAPDVIVNPAAYTDVDGAEKNPAIAAKVNAEAVRVLGEEAKRAGIGLVHYSTDFVFDGKKGGEYVEDDAPNPLNEYGRSKLRGEQVLSELDAPAIVLRTAWVWSLRKKSFVSAILKLARERDTLRIVADQVGNPTFCRDLAQATAAMLYAMRSSVREQLRDARGIYHLAGTGSCSRFELARRILELDPHKSEHKVRTLEPIGSDAYPLPAVRPTHAPLDCSRFEQRFGLRLPRWEASLARQLAG
ncbi:MAG: dTDP-4-dehydrorhamnose reductase [Deltaproteobacteria bacterium]|nr:dTDP-4-dehydrorhamnose reductase [Deltaproteobacteria bacterium]